MLEIKAIEICKKHYKGWQARINGCESCPLHDACITNKPTRTAEELKAWQEKINTIAGTTDEI